MAYRDDHEALGWRVEELEKQLADAQHDHEEVARLRGELDKASAELAKLRKKAASPSTRTSIPRRRWLVPLVLSMSIGPIAAGILVAVIGGSSSSHAEGSITSEGGKLGTWTAVPDSCGSRTDRFGGLNLFEHDKNRFRFIVDAHGTKSITVFDAAGAGYRADEADCKTLTGTITEQQRSSRSRTRLQGEVTFDCTIAGGRVYGSAMYKDCR